MTPPSREPIIDGIVSRVPIPGPPPPPPLVLMKSIPCPRADITLPRLSGGTEWVMYDGAPDMRKLLAMVAITIRAVMKTMESAYLNKSMGIEPRMSAPVSTLFEPSLSTSIPAGTRRTVLNTAEIKRMSPHWTSLKPRVCVV